jgi:hypothetical protein
MSVARQQIQDIIDRWTLTLESIDDQRYGIYANVSVGTRVLLIVWSDFSRINSANDFIDLYLKESNPELASRLLSDIEVLVKDLENLDDFRFH